ncbi:hypothetical protein D9M70_634040 [compost metagenome]
MVLLCLVNHGRLPPARRRYYQDYAQKEALEYVEHLTITLLYGAEGVLSPRSRGANRHGDGAES